MPVNGRELIQSVGNKLTSAPIVKNVTRNPFYTAILISVIIVLIILFVFRNVTFEESNESLYKLSLRVGVYSLFIVTAIQFLQNQNVLAEVTEGGNSNKIDDVFNAVDRPGSIVKLNKTGGSQSTSDVLTEGGQKSSEECADTFVPVGIDVSFI